MFTWVGSQFDAVLSTYVLGVVSDADDCDRTHRVDRDDDLGRALRLGGAAQRGLGDLADLHVEGLQDRPGAGLRAAVRLLHQQRRRTRRTRWRLGVASTFLPAGANPATVATPYALLDKFNDEASQLVLDI